MELMVRRRPEVSVEAASRDCMRIGADTMPCALVATPGLYSVMSYSVAQRTHEMGVRIALGARTRTIIGMIVRQGVAMATMGIAVGVGLALGVGGRLKALLFDTSPRDPVVIAIATSVLLAAAVAASVWPALRAGSVDPIRSLKAD